jgi:hypothetical protein
VEGGFHLRLPGSSPRVNGQVHKTLLLMLRADAPGEVVAARDALLRIAETGKLDAYDLTAAILFS